MTNTTLNFPSPEFDAAVLAINDDNKKKAREDLLSRRQIEVIQALLRGRPAVECTARDIFGLHWQKIYSKTKLGGRIHVTVEKELIPELCSVETNSTSKRYRHSPQLARNVPTTGSDLRTTDDAADSTLMVEAA